MKTKEVKTNKRATPERIWLKCWRRVQLTREIWGWLAPFVSTFEKVTTSNVFREDFAGDSNAFATVENNDAKTNKRTEKTTPLLSTKNRFCCRIIIVFIVDKKRTSRLSASLSRALFVLRSYEEYCVCVVLLCGTPNTNKYVTTWPPFRSKSPPFFVGHFGVHFFLRS